MAISPKDKFSFKLRKFAELSKEDTWTKYLKPDLLKMKTEKSESEEVAKNGYKSIVNDVARATTNKLINRIIRLVENAEFKLDKK